MGSSGECTRNLNSSPEVARTKLLCELLKQLTSSDLPVYDQVFSAAFVFKLTRVTRRYNLVSGVVGLMPQANRRISLKYGCTVGYQPTSTKIQIANELLITQPYNRKTEITDEDIGI